MTTDPATYARFRAAAEQVAAYGKVEIADGQVLLSLPPTAAHTTVAHHIADQLRTRLPHTHPRHTVRLGSTLECPGLGRLYRPDVTVAPGEAEEPRSVLLVTEVVPWSTPSRAYDAKVRDYATMGIPLYLLVDPRDGTGIVHSQPGYAAREKFVFGDKIAVGPWTLDTGELLTYA
ncbi:Uma2 family endonuclease [Kitasatospora sp. MAP12-15]|uniref:Uma2 family endonuclease n=1 Tax=unclassified Kitasatospora TaxID=2633591 RepID=UPI002476A468|nr:Uma2 family endonuclease [Kitasatospora sp. MAP12-44]MDH6110869.1 Uma2 family endonuclease [Kitasatospora sp. MAP12-44]